MYINRTGYYIPSGRLDNSAFKDLNGLDDEWIVRRTGIHSRSQAAPGETQDDMALRAIDNALDPAPLPYPLADVDLIVQASYTVTDTVATCAHVAQRHYGMHSAKAMYLSSACSSFINGLETVECYFRAGKASKALLISPEINSLFANTSDPASGHLWGDGAVAFFLSADRMSPADMEVLRIHTAGLGHIGKGPEGVHLKPRDGGISMPYGRDVFVNACQYIESSLRSVLEPEGLQPAQLSAICCHQANLRILTHVAHSMGLDPALFPSNIGELGNTGSASAAIVMAQRLDTLAKGDLVALSVFGGGYSTGAALIRV